MRSGISTSYFKTVPKKITLRERANLYKKLNYWHLVPILKIIYALTPKIAISAATSVMPQI